eukprot:CAMPEP_0171177154 /NCGR_PEP_ID=MMETSP0790-20130122/12096_1 /TAXON_ID=2925 /ORGANISM="Alexandrium catenella, Strain OF101" /LENGTH=102 /DNA_ID=CAMNT_0011642049 /DNA_START=83 /DNA_END=388 /DNA_ORIENTATION=+
MSTLGLIQATILEPLPSRPASLAVLLLDVARNVHEEGDRQEQRLDNVADVEVLAHIHPGPLGVDEEELNVAIQADRKEEHREEGKLIGAEGLEVAGGVARHL